MAEQEDLREFSYHVFYEFSMFATMAYKLAFDPPGLRDQATTNAYIESFCIHYRNVHDFLYSIHVDGYQNDLKAKQYFKGALRRAFKPQDIVEKQSFADDQDKIDTQIAHLTSQRFIDRIGKEWDFWEIYKRMKPLLVEFDSLVREQYLHEKWDSTQFLLDRPLDEKSDNPGAITGVLQQNIGGTDQTEPPNYGSQLS